GTVKLSAEEPDALMHARPGPWEPWRATARATQPDADSRKCHPCRGVADEARKSRAGESGGGSGRPPRRLRTRRSRQGGSLPLEPSAKRREGRADRSRPALRGSPYRSSLPSHL